MFTEETSTKLLTALIWHGLGRSISLAYLPIKKTTGKKIRQIAYSNPYIAGTS